MIATFSTIDQQPLPLEKLSAPRLLSLDVFRGLVIFLMLIVNNLGDYETAGYFWKHADWLTSGQSAAFGEWWLSLLRKPVHRAFMEFPLWRQCTLADFVMPWFMLIIGVAIPFSAAAGRARTIPARRIWLRTLRRAGLLIVLGWSIDNSIAFSNYFHSADPGRRFTISLGMDVLQLLGVAYLVTRVLYEISPGGRFVVAMALFAMHYWILRFARQGSVPAGTFTETHNAVGYIYSSWVMFRNVDLLGWMGPGTRGRVTGNVVGILSVAPAAATMILGTLIGDHLGDEGIGASARVRRLATCGFGFAVIGFVVGFDLAFNKPRWSPSYLLYTSGVGAMVIALLYWIIDVRRARGWTRFFVVFGANSIAVYWLSIMAKVWLLNTPRMRRSNGDVTNVANFILRNLKSHFGRSAGGWMFTICFVGFWWVVLDWMYRRRIFWKL